MKCLQICVCGVSSTLSPLYWNDDPKKSSPTLTPLNSAALSMWETPILLRYSFFLTVAPLPRTMPGNTSSQSIPCLCLSHLASFPSNPSISLASGVRTSIYFPTSAAAAFLSLLVRIGESMLAILNLRPFSDVLQTLFLGGGGLLLLAAAILLFSFFFLRAADL